jgi:hypothetical protein
LDALRVYGERPAGEPRAVFCDGPWHFRLRAHGNR